MQRLADALPVERAASRWIVSDRPGRARREDQALPRPRASGTWSSTPPATDQERFLELYGSEVLPKLRSSGRAGRPRRVR